MKRNGWLLCLFLCIGCSVMAVVDGVIQPGYLPKSAGKIGLFLSLIFLYTRFDRSFRPWKLLGIRGKTGMLALLCGLGLYGLILGCFFAARLVFDFSRLTASLNAQTGVSGENFLYVALYISFVNSLLEELFFRGFGFLQLKKVANPKTAYLVSSGLFALYHTAMMLGWYSPVVLGLVIAGLFLGGVLFDFVDARTDSILPSWIIHMFANFAINTIGFLLFAGG